MRYLVKVTRKGQVTIPKPIRDALEIKEGEHVQVTIKEGRVIITKPDAPTPGTSVGPEKYKEIIKELEEARAQWR